MCFGPGVGLVGKPQSEHLNEDLQTLLEVSRVINSSLQLEEVLRTVVEQGMQMLGAEAGTVWLEDEEGEWVIPRVVLGPKAAEVKKLRLRWGEGLVGLAMAQGRGSLVEDVTRDPNWASRIDSASGFITRSLICVPLTYNDRGIGALQFVNKLGDQRFTPIDLELATALANQAAVAIEKSRLFEEQHTLLCSIIRAMAAAIDARDPYTRGHSERVSAYALMIADELGLGGRFRERLEWAGLLHDIGKIGVRDEVLLKRERLTTDELDKIRQHPLIGANIIEYMEPKHLLWEVFMAARHHQEKYDGTGYPDGLQGEDIPLVARIVGLADAFDAMTTDRPYGKARPFEVALQEIERCAGTHFDPDVARAFLAAMRRGLQEGRLPPGIGLPRPAADGESEAQTHGIGA